MPRRTRLFSRAPLSPLEGDDHQSMKHRVVLHVPLGTDLNKAEADRYTKTVNFDMTSAFENIPKNTWLEFRLLDHLYDSMNSKRLLQSAASTMTEFVADMYPFSSTDDLERFRHAMKDSIMRDYRNDPKLQKSTRRSFGPVELQSKPADSTSETLRYRFPHPRRTPQGDAITILGQLEWDAVRVHLDPLGVRKSARKQIGDLLSFASLSCQMPLTAAEREAIIMKVVKGIDETSDNKVPARQTQPVSKSPASRVENTTPDPGVFRPHPEGMSVSNAWITIEV